MTMTRKFYQPYRSPFDPCRPLPCETYETPPELFLGFQPYHLQQYKPLEALKQGTLWPALFDPYENPYKQMGKGGKP
ncbi:MAG TPA: spore coat associated protein CotJA [Bacillales bacterium]|nr:spore coat associated protein CotJA [Bacillales bacterium]